MEADADGNYIRRLDWAGGDVIQFDVASGQTSRIVNKGTRVERLYYVEGLAFSRDGKQVAFDRETKDEGSDLWVGISTARTSVRSTAEEAQPFDWSPDGGSILALRKVSGEANNQLVLIRQPTAQCGPEERRSSPVHADEGEVFSRRAVHRLQPRG